MCGPGRPAVMAVVEPGQLILGQVRPQRRSVGRECAPTYISFLYNVRRIIHVNLAGRSLTVAMWGTELGKEAGWQERCQ